MVFVALIGKMWYYKTKTTKNKIKQHKEREKPQKPKTKKKGAQL